MSRSRSGSGKPRRPELGVECAYCGSAIRESGHLLCPECSRENQSFLTQPKIARFPRESYLVVARQLAEYGWGGIQVTKRPISVVAEVP